MHILTAEGEGSGGLTEAVDHPMTGDGARLRIDMEGVADHTGEAGIAGEGGNLSIGRNPTHGNLPDKVVYDLKGIVLLHMPS